MLKLKPLMKNETRKKIDPSKIKNRRKNIILLVKLILVVSVIEKTLTLI